jgi:two-component system NtrC family response regulator
MYWIEQSRKEQAGREDKAVAKVLIIDDDEQVCRFLSDLFSEMQFEVTCRMNLTDGLARIYSEDFDVLFLDVNLPDGNGIDAIEVIKKQRFSPEVIIMTADEDPDGAELAMKSKAWDYISKKGSHKKYKFALERAYEYRRQKQSRRHLQTLDRNGIIGQSRLVSECIDKVAIAAMEDYPVLVTGETGTGKELFSKAIHDNSRRFSADFIVVDCASLPEHLVESTLFGHVKGAFTGADSDKTGLMEMADGGTLFLDEVGELPFPLQKKFLRAIQEKKFRPVGGKDEVISDFRLISATHRDLKAMVKANEFREDLYFRLFSIHIHLPPLKERESDIRLLTEHRLRTGVARKKELRLSQEFFDELELYDWPGNVRELMNTIDLISGEAVDGVTLYPHYLPEHIRAFNMRQKFSKAGNVVPSPGGFQVAGKGSLAVPKFKDHLDQSKSAYIKRLMAVTRGDKKKAIEVSGLSMGHLYRLLQQFGIK